MVELDETVVGEELVEILELYGEVVAERKYLQYQVFLELCMPLVNI